MDWSISIPHRRRDESVVDVMSHCRHLPRPDDARVVRQIVFGLRLDRGLTSAGAVLDHIEALTPAERRVLIDQARSALGLQSIEMIDAGERIRQTSRPSALTMCRAPGCTNVPIAEGGVLSTPRVKRWFCPAHIDQAEPGDMQPRGFGVRYSENGVIVPDDPVDRHREQVAAESRRHEVAARDEQATVEAEAMRRHQQAIREQTHREIPESLRRFYP